MHIGAFNELAYLNHLHAFIMNRLGRHTGPEAMFQVIAA